MTRIGNLWQVLLAFALAVFANSTAAQALQIESLIPENTIHVRPGDKAFFAVVVKDPIQGTIVEGAQVCVSEPMALLGGCVPNLTDSSGRLRFSVTAPDVASGTSLQLNFEANKAGSASPSLARQLLVETPKFGVTVIVHGYIAPGIGISWTDSMAKAILGRAGCGRLYVYHAGSDGAGSGDWLERIFPTGIPGFDASACASGQNGEQVIIVDWQSESNEASPGFAEATANSVFALLVGGISTNRSQPWTGLSFSHTAFLAKQAPYVDIHFIAHSFGTVVASEAIRRLSQLEIPVERLTLLDPHDFNEGWLPVDGGAKMPDVQIWPNIAKVDNYYQKFDNPTGRYIEGDTSKVTNYALSLNDRFIQMRDCFFRAFPNLPSACHSVVHSYYHGTIDRAAATDGDGVDIVDAAQGGSWYLPFGRRYEHGYALSRLGGKLPNVTSSGASQGETNGETNCFSYPVEFIFKGDFGDTLGGYEECAKTSGSAAGFRATPDVQTTPDGRGRAAFMSPSNTRFETRLAYVPVNASVLRFKYWVEDRIIFVGDDDALDVYIDETLVDSVPMGQNAQGTLVEKGTWFERVSFIPESFKGKSATFRFELNGHVILATQVFVDNIKIYEGPTPVDGGCGASHGATFTSAPVAGLCSTGIASSVSGTGPWTWTCAGSAGGVEAICSAIVSGSGLTPQTVSFPAQASQAYVNGATFQINPLATASSGLTNIVYSSRTLSRCTATGTSVTMVAAGTCTLRATQAGNETYAAAYAERSFGLIGQITETITYSSDTTLPSGHLYANVEIASGVVDLAGRTLTIHGSLVIRGGELKVNGGRLNVLGNLHLPQEQGVLKMTNPLDWVLVQGNFTTETFSDHGAFLTAGTLEVRGNFTQNVCNCGLNNRLYNFAATGTHRVLLSGTGAQTVSFSSLLYSRFQVLEITNTSSAGLNLGPMTVTTFISSPANNLGPVHITQSTTTIPTIKAPLTISSSTIVLTQDATITGDFDFYGATLDLAGKTLTVTGSLVLHVGELRINGGRLNVLGNLHLPQEQGVLKMTNPLDWVLVQGNFTTETFSDHGSYLTAGTLEVRGNFTQNVCNCGPNTRLYNFAATGTHRVLLSGTGAQTVSFSSLLYSRFQVLEITNTSSAGLNLGPMTVTTFISSPVNNLGPVHITQSTTTIPTIKAPLTISSSTIVLTEDATVTGDFTFERDTLDLAGKTLTVNGNFSLRNGELRVNGGRLVVLGNLHLPMEQGVLRMTNPSDWVLVHGNFTTETFSDHGSYLTAGTLEVRGNFTQNVCNCGPNTRLYNFAATGTHRVLLSGTGNQSISFASPDYSVFNILEWIGSPARLQFLTPYFVRLPNAQAIQFIAPSSKYTSDLPFQLSATGGPSGNAVSFSTATPTICTLSTSAGNTTVTLTGTSGTCTITANQAGGLGYADAAPVTRNIQVIAPTFTVTILVGQNGSAMPSGAIPVGAGQALVIDSTPLAGFVPNVSGTCGGTLAGNSFTTAPVAADCTVNIAFVATLSPPGAPIAVNASAGDGQAIINFQPPANTGGSPITSYAVNCSPGSIVVFGPLAPLIVQGLANGTVYSCTVTASNMTGAGPASTSVLFTPNPPFALLSVVSRKIHGAAGAKDMVIDPVAPMVGQVTVDPRILGSGHVVVFKFNLPVNAVGATAVMDTNATAVMHSVSMAGNEMTISIPSLANAKRVTVSVTGINGSVSKSVAVGFLQGDVNGSRAVDITDVRAIKARSGWIVDDTNFLFDINLSGRISSTDVIGVRARQGTSLP